jgi:hypothetical protein
MKKPKARDTDVVGKFKRVSDIKMNDTEKEIKKSFNAFKKQNKNKVDIQLSDAIDELFLDGGEFDDLEENNLNF